MSERRRRPFVDIVHGVVDRGGRPDEADTLIEAEVVAEALGRLGIGCEIRALGSDLAVLAGWREAGVDLVFNLVETWCGEGCRAHELPQRLEALGVPYTGCGAAALAATSDKMAAKRRMEEHGIPTPPWSADGAGLPPATPVIVKPNGEDASLGIDAGSVVDSEAAPHLLAARARQFGGAWFAEAFVDGRELNLSILDGPQGPELLPVAEILFVDFPAGRPHIVDYEAKWLTDGFAFTHTPRRFDFPAEDAALIGRLGEIARRCWRVFGLAGYARVDFRVDPNRGPMVLEINGNPCLSPDGGFAAAAATAGLDLTAVVARIVRAAVPDLIPAGDWRWREEVRPADVEAVRALVAETGFFNGEEVAIAAELVSERLTRGDASGYHFVLAEDADGRLAGYTCHGPIAGAPGRSDLYWIVVRPDRQGAGLGRALLQRTERAIADGGGRRIYVETSGRPQYAPTRAFYLRCGFRQEAELADFYGNGDAKLILVKILPG
jgi:D-alanine-D-alanine ligase-like ATP-grasp enzyme/ribosomal protein S18 acetylase RimI-like enzyme